MAIRSGQDMKTWNLTRYIDEAEKEVRPLSDDKGLQS